MAETCTVPDHEHNFGLSTYQTVGMCSTEGCVEMRVGTAVGGWRELTSAEKVSVTCAMWEDLIMVDAFSIIHGKDRGPARYKYLTGRGDPA